MLKITLVRLLALALAPILFILRAAGSSVDFYGREVQKCIKKVGDRIVYIKCVMLSKNDLSPMYEIARALSFDAHERP
jgi:hypothetical protein